jgi:hypothetical protein
MTKKPPLAPDPEIAAISDVYAALKELVPEAQARVLSYVADKLQIEPPTARIDLSRRVTPPGEPGGARTDESGAEAKEDPQDELGGISPVAKKWLTRNGLRGAQLSQIFSLWTDEIDLIANTVPGRNKKDKMRSVFLLKGVAAYLGSGAARFSHQQIKEACLHYDAFDPANFAAYFRSLAAEVSGTKDAGYTLTARGLASATEMVKNIAQPAQTA